MIKINNYFINRSLTLQMFHFDPSQGFIPAGNWDGEQISPMGVCGDPTGDLFRRVDSDGELLSDGEFPIAITNNDEANYTLDSSN